MNKTWLKATLAVEMLTPTGEPLKQNFTGIVKDANDEQLLAFAKVLETVTGNDFFSAKINDSFEYTAVTTA